MSAEEIKQLQVILDQKSQDFKSRQKSAKKEMSAADLFKYMDGHQQEMESLEKRLALERLRMEQNLKDKMAARRFRRPGSAASVEVQSNCQGGLIKSLKRFRLIVDVTWTFVSLNKSEDIKTVERKKTVKESISLWKKNPTSPHCPKNITLVQCPSGLN